MGYSMTPAGVIPVAAVPGAALAAREETVRVLVVEDNPGDSRLIQEDLGEAGGFRVEAVDRLSQALERLAGGGFDIVLADLSLPDSGGFETLTKLRAHASVPLIVLTGIEDDQLALRAVSEGAQDYLIKGRMSGPSIARCIRYAIERHRAMLTRLGPSARLGKIVAFLGGKGGAGTTTLALNLAAVLGQQRSRTLAIELRPDFGAFSCQLQQNPPRPVNHLLEQPADRIGAPELVPHLVDLPFGMQALFGPQRLEDFGDVSGEHAEAILMAAARNAEWVVVDLPVGASAANRAAVRVCNYLVLVLERDATSVAVARMTRDLLVSWGITENRIGAALVNRVPAVSSLSLSEVRAQLGCPILAVIPHAADACSSAQKTGTPFAITHPDLNASQAVVEMVRRLSAAKVEALVM